jgi:hypothetical protein
VVIWVWGKFTAFFHVEKIQDFVNSFESNAMGENPQYRFFLAILKKGKTYRSVRDGHTNQEIVKESEGS